MVKVPIDISDKIVLAKINNKLVSNVLYKTNANYKGRKQKQNKKMKLKVLLQKSMLKKELVMKACK